MARPVGRPVIEEEESGGGFAKVMFIVTPILFLVVLIGALFMFLNGNLKNDLIGMGQKIPIVKNWLPEPSQAAKQAESSKETVNSLKKEMAKKEEVLNKANEDAKVQAAKTQSVQNELDAANEALNKQKSQESSDQANEYQKEVKKLANLYGSMNAGKAAAIMENLTTEETVQMLGAMSNDSKAAILEKMDAKKAAQVSILLKDAKTSEDLAIAALQSRLKKDAGGDSKNIPQTQGLTDAQITQTFSTMTAESAAKLLLQTDKISPDKTLKILKAVDDASRSKILTEMNKTEPATTSRIVNKLLSN
ncbi:flagellar motility protein MotE (MotC chaperone) [Paenibacillus shirakamiensis]|uniref:Flagellar motility protein MotE (MotC chaperone) n=1 Tax=Paenibacillus shirakamiensis TaxID=1265935 RepID=A0ABS4JHB6_9BACL|nr:hypothetical protein [Paenibacillus shirakamiensis]MBP2001117.1 flagellar motility protein MotE (MotC chaperone) [Paenibacillus shirakamiensis]